ncbi:MAG: response regulator, partial [Bacteroidales bacterium]|nr:response regulator [Bacteroidales bacterium]
MKRMYNVLIVDDEFLARKLLTEYVSKIDYLNLVDTCSDATKAMEVLAKEHIDILMLDIQMPD